MYMRIRNICGLLGVVLPWLALFSAGIAQHPSNEWWWSISATYYQSPALVGVLVPASLVLLLYIGYDKKDDVLTSISGVFGLCIVLFPCKVSWMDENSRVGFFQIPMYISAYMHNICAGIFFALLAYNSVFQFTQSSGEMTDRKKKRNLIYRICGYGMFFFELVFVGLTIFDAPGYCVMLVEIVLLHLFGISWLVKGETFSFLNDIEETADENNGDSE